MTEFLRYVNRALNRRRSGIHGDRTFEFPGNSMGRKLIDRATNNYSNGVGIPFSVSQAVALINIDRNGAVAIIGGNLANNCAYPHEHRALSSIFFGACR